MTAQPNPWDIQLAFDNSPVTRWRSWQDAEPGMYIEVDFGKSQRIGAVVVESSGDSQQTSMKLEGQESDGRWTTLAEHPDESIAPVRVSLRASASAELKARGIRYIMMDDSDFRAEDFRDAALAAQAKLPNDPVGDWYQGGTFCSDEYSGDAPADY